MNRGSYHRVPVSPHPKCPDPYCGKTWAPNKATARQLHREVAAYTNNWNPVRFYECSGGYHWTSDVEGSRRPTGT